MSFDFDDPLDPMSPFFQDEFIFNKEDEPKKRRSNCNDSDYDATDSDDEEDGDDRDDW